MIDFIALINLVYSEKKTYVKSNDSFFLFAFYLYIVIQKNMNYFDIKKYSSKILKFDDRSLYV